MSCFIVYRDKSNLVRTFLDYSMATYPQLRDVVREFATEEDAIAYAESYLPAETGYAVVELHEV